MSVAYRRVLGVAALYLLMFTIVIGLIYPFVMWGAGRIFADKADGSFLRNAQGEIVGSRLIGQEFTEPGQFHSRPSAGDYNALDSGATNLAIGDETLLADIEQRRNDIAALEQVSPDQVPDDAVTASASGLDPHISPEYAEIQVPRVARETGRSEDSLRQLILESKEGRGINVLRLNLALQQ